MYIQCYFWHKGPLSKDDGANVAVTVVATSKQYETEFRREECACNSDYVGACATKEELCLWFE